MEQVTCQDLGKLATMQSEGDDRITIVRVVACTRDSHIVTARDIATGATIRVDCRGLEWYGHAS